MLRATAVSETLSRWLQGFAMLRQLTSTQNNPYEALAQPQPVYVEGYGFVPPSQADVLRNQTPAGLAAPGLGSVNQVPSGQLPHIHGWSWQPAEPA